MKHKLLYILWLAIPTLLSADIYEPEGINMPGDWNSWANPPTVMALANGNQTTGGKIIKITTGTPRWQTTIHVAESGGDITGGSYKWLFTSGPSGNYFSNKWAGVSITMNTLQTYTFNTGADNSITVINGKWYTVNWEDKGYTDTRAIFMETSEQPAAILTVSQIGTSRGDGSYVTGNESDTVFITTDKVLSPEEKLYIRYGVNGFETDGFIQAVSAGGADYYAILPNDAGRGDTTHYYALTSTLMYTVGGDLDNNTDLLTLARNTNSGANWQVISDVNRPPVIQTVIGDQTVEAGETLILNLTATDADGDSLSWQTLEKPEGATLTDNGDGTAVFAWTPGSSDTGTHTITLVVTDATAKSQILIVNLKQE